MVKYLYMHPCGGLIVYLVYIYLKVNCRYGDDKTALSSKALRDVMINYGRITRIYQTEWRMGVSTIRKK